MLQKTLISSDHERLWVICGLYVKVDILLTCGKHLHDCIISLRGKFSINKTSLTPPLVVEVLVPSQECERFCMCVLH
jgi:hypothetical protein